MIHVRVDPPTTKTGMELVETEIDPEIKKFEDWFKDPSRGNGPLTRLEKEVLRAYLYQKAIGTF